MQRTIKAMVLEALGNAIENGYHLDFRKADAERAERISALYADLLNHDVDLAERVDYMNDDDNAEMVEAIQGWILSRPE